MSLRVHLLLAAMALVAACTEARPNACDEAERFANADAFESAVRSADACLARSDLAPADRVRGHRARAWGFYGLANYAKAAEDQVAVVSIGTPFLEDLNNASLFLRKAGRAAESLQSARRAAELDRAAHRVRMDTQYQLGWSYFAVGDYRRAIAAFTAGIPSQPDFAFVYWRRGLAFHRLGDAERARLDFVRFAEYLTPELAKTVSWTEAQEIQRVLGHYQVRSPFPDAAPDD